MLGLWQRENLQLITIHFGGMQRGMKGIPVFLMCPRGNYETANEEREGTACSGVIGCVCVLIGINV